MIICDVRQLLENKRDVEELAVLARRGTYEFRSTSHVAFVIVSSAYLLLSPMLATSSVTRRWLGRTVSERKQRTPGTQCYA